jgi:hypothetical protein
MRAYACLPSGADAKGAQHGAHSSCRASTSRRYVLQVTCWQHRKAMKDLHVVAERVDDGCAYLFKVLCADPLCFFNLCRPVVPQPR